MNYLMFIKLLINNWFVRSFILLLWFFASLFGVIGSDMPKQTTTVLFFLGFANFFVYLSVSMRSIILTRHYMARLLPNYFTLLKKALLTILLVSYLPALFLLPNVTLCFAVLSILTITAILLMAISYYPVMTYVIVSIFFIPTLMKYLSLDFSMITTLPWLHILAYTFPFIIILMGYLLSRLETFKGNEKHIQRLLFLANISTQNAVVTMEKMPLNQRSKIVQWLANRNVAYYRHFIRDLGVSNKKFTPYQVIKLATQTITTFGTSQYVFSSIVLIIAMILGEYLQNIWLVMLTIALPISLIGSGTISFFQSINAQKNVLQKMSLLPIFTPTLFAKNFVKVVFVNQVKLYSFIALSVFIFSMSSKINVFEQTINIIMLLTMLMIVNLIVMFSGWLNKQLSNNVFLWLMIIINIAFMAYLLVINLLALNQSIFLFTSINYWLFFIASALALIAIIKRAYQHIPCRFN